MTQCLEMILVWPDRAARTSLAVAALAPLLLAAFGAAEGATPAVQVSIEQPAAGVRLMAGSTTAVRWTQLPAEVEEFELLLSLDGDPSFTVRLTPQRDPSSRELSWEVAQSTDARGTAAAARRHRRAGDRERAERPVRHCRLL